MTTSAAVRLVILLAVITFAAAPAPSASANAQPNRPPRAIEITCPVAMLRTEVTTRLPKPWWQTPQEGKLESVKIENIGGKPALMCGYWAYGTQVFVMRPFPEHVHGCKAVGNHFVCD
jgi:hypothetical protein